MSRTGRRKLEADELMPFTRRSPFVNVRRRIIVGSANTKLVKASTLQKVSPLLPSWRLSTRALETTNVWLTSTKFTASSAQRVSLPCAVPYKRALVTVILVEHGLFDFSRRRQHYFLRGISLLGLLRQEVNPSLFPTRALVDSGAGERDDFGKPWSGSLLLQSSEPRHIRMQLLRWKGRRCMSYDLHPGERRA
ncbi:hypothetical protein SCHPADRAFT_452440 [Schizopora paradoxa]|uniref:Uncharacterized protein n=1 Tax=Schizopora paradoxa TaxID=27342 RepID=A0A0H2RQL5_9AGAM|nr:hypothetical protein SCHPADRAFT_452440 [Schizopora paradoxa]